MRSNLARIITSAFLACSLASCQSAEEKIEKHMARGNEYRDAEQWDEAIIEYKNVVQLDPNDGPAHFQLSQAYLKAGKAREAFWELRETVRLDPSNGEAKLQFAQFSILSGEVEEGLGRIDEVIADEPENAVAYLLRGQALEALKRTDEAQASMEKAVEVDPEHQESYAMLGAFHQRHGNREAAESYFVRASELAPNFENFINLGSFYVMDADKARDAEAEAAYRKAIEVAEGEQLARGYAVLGGFLFTRDRFDPAVETIEEGIAKVEDPLDLIYLLARIYRVRGDDAKADALAVRATELKADDPRPHLVLSALKGRQGDFAGALVSAEKAVELAPSSDRARLRLAEVLIEYGFRQQDKEMIARGRKIADEVVAVEPSNPGAMFVIAKLHLAESRPEEAIKALRGAIDARPSWAEAHFLLGTALASTGERTAARTELAQALEIDAGLIEARRVLADVHAGLGEHEYAVEEGRRYLAVHADSVPVRVRIAQSLVLMGKFDEALAEVQSIDESARDANVNYAIGRIYLAQNDDAKARTYLMAALAEQPTHAEILNSLLILDERAGQLETSAARIRKAVSEDPDNADLQRLAGTLAVREDDATAAEAAFKRAIELDPEDIEGYRQLANFYAATGRRQETIDVYEKSLAVAPNQPKIHHMLGVLYEYGGQRERAIEHYEAAVKWAPDQAQSKNNLAYIYAESGENLDRALDLAQSAKALLPDDPNAADTLGWVLYRRGVPGAAIAYLREAEAGMSAETGDLGLVRHHLALAYEASGDSARAKEALENALEAREAYVEARKARGDKPEAEPAWYAEALAMLERL